PPASPSLAPSPAASAPPPATSSLAPSYAPPAASPSTSPSSLAPPHSGIAPTGTAAAWTGPASLAAPALPTNLDSPWSTPTAKATEREPLTRGHWAILSLCALAGLLLTLYRNDVLRD